MLLRAPNKRQLRLMRDQARLAALSPADSARGAAAAESFGTVGGTDATTGEFLTYGLIGFTTLGTPFRVKGT